MNKTALQKAGFSAVTRCPRRLIANIQGMTKAGKTRLALTAKKPMGFISIEIGGDEGVVDQFIPDGMDANEDIQIIRIKMDNPAYPSRADYPGGKEGDKGYDEAVSMAVQEVAAVALDKFYEAYYASLENMATTVVDTGSDLWELVRLSNFGRLEKIPQLAYGQMNKSMDKLIEDAFSYTGSVIFLHHMKEKWENVMENGKLKSTPSGVFELAGYSGMKKKVQATIEMWREDLTQETADNDTGRLVTFHCQIMESRHNPDAMGTAFKNDFTFADIGVTIIGNSKKVDWQ